MDENDDTDLYTPERLAWQLLYGNIDDAKKGFDAYSVCPDNENQFTFLFEILFTIFMELLFNIAKISFYSEHENNQKFIPDYEKFNMEIFLSIISDKFALLSYLVNIRTYTNDDFIGNYDLEYRNLVDNRYCRVILKYYYNNSDSDNNIFTHMDDNLYYHMHINALVNSNKFKKIEEVYAIIMLNYKFYKISFVK